MLCSFVKECAYVDSHCKGTPEYFQPFLQREQLCDFLFANLHDNTKWSQLLKERICSCRSKFFALRIDSRKEENGNVACPKSVPIHQKFPQTC